MSWAIPAVHAIHSFAGSSLVIDASLASLLRDHSDAEAVTIIIAKIYMFTSR